MNLKDRIINLCINYDKLFAALIAKYRHFDDSIFKIEKYYPWCNELIGKYFNSMSLNSLNIKYFFENIPFNNFCKDSFDNSDLLKLVQFNNNPSLLRDANSFIRWVSTYYDTEKINFQKICKNSFLTIEIIDKLNNFHNKLDWSVISTS